MEINVLIEPGLEGCPEVSWLRSVAGRVLKAQEVSSPPDGVLHLGEVIIAYPQAVIQAEEHRHSVKREVAILIIHGVLHLLGYRDDKPELKRLMSTREREILSYIEGGKV
jgi:probable rRNA maturation factor